MTQESDIIIAAKIIADALRGSNAVPDLSGLTLPGGLDMMPSIEDHINNSPSLYGGDPEFAPVRRKESKFNLAEASKMIGLGLAAETLEQKDWAFRHLEDILGLSEDTPERLDG